MMRIVTMRSPKNLNQKTHRLYLPASQAPALPRSQFRSTYFGSGEAIRIVEAIPGQKTWLYRTLLSLLGCE